VIHRPLGAAAAADDDGGAGHSDSAKVAAAAADVAAGVAGAVDAAAAAADVAAVDYAADAAAVAAAAAGGAGAACWDWDSAGRRNCRKKGQQDEEAFTTLAIFSGWLWYSDLFRSVYIFCIMKKEQFVQGFASDSV